jgi:cold shock CspA family protein/ribosome-associated translation inhibitor RaiA
MEIPLQVTFRSTPPSKAVEAHIREKADKLDMFYNRIMGCRVVVEAPHRRHHKGKRYHVRIDMTVPGGKLVVNREPSKHIEYEDVYVAVRDAFDAARRQLQNYARRQRKEVKTHELIPHAYVGKLFLEKGFGFLELPDGREVYFHRNSVLEMPFDLMEVGMEVHFAEEQGEKGPQASTVRPIRKHHH